MTAKTDYGPGVPGDPYPGYVTPEEAEAIEGTGTSNAEALADHDADTAAHADADFVKSTDVDDAITAHTDDTDPHPSYTTGDEVDTKVSDHDADSGAHSIAGFASDVDIAGAVSDHEGASDPHPTYETSTEAASKVTTHAAVTTSVHGITNTASLETTSGATTKVSNHSAATDPHGDRAYADSVATGLDIKASVKAATTANITLSGAQTIDGVSIVALDRVLVKNQTTTKDNGIYVAASGAWARSTDADTSGEVTAGLFTYVEQGTVNGTSSFVANSAGTLGTDPVVFTQFNTAGSVTAGAGLTKTGSTLDIVSGGGLTVAADTITVAADHGGSTHAAVEAYADSQIAVHAAGDEYGPSDIVVFYDGSNYIRKDMRSLTNTSGGSSSVHGVLNAAMTALGTGTGNSAAGGHIKLATPTGRIMTSTAPIVMQNGVRLEGTGRGCTIKASGTWGGTLASPTPMVDARSVSRVNIEYLTLECAGLAGISGIVYSSGVGDGPSWIKQNWVRNARISGIQIGVSGTSNFSQNIYIAENEVLSTDTTGDSVVGGGTIPGAPGAFVGVVFYNGDCHYLAGNNIKINAATGYPMLVSAGSVHVIGESHFANNNSSNTRGLITVTKGGNNRFEGLYLDNMNAGPAFDLTAADAAVTRNTITGNWIHNTLGTDLGASLFKVSSTAHGNFGHVITSNTSEGADNSHRAKAILEVTNATGKSSQSSIVCAHNSVQFCKDFVLVGGAVGTVGVGGSTNIIDDSGPSSSSPRYGP